MVHQPLLYIGEEMVINRKDYYQGVCDSTREGLQAISYLGRGENLNDKMR